jgi:hypothetical protein
MNKLTNRTALALIAAAFLATHGASGEEAKPTMREQIRQMHEAWVAAGKPRPESVSFEPKFGINSFNSVNVHAYQFQANTSTDLILDDGNGYRYFGAPGVPYMAAPVTLPRGSRIDTITVSYCSETAGDLVFTL